MTYTKNTVDLSRSDRTVFEKVLDHFTLLEEYGNPINDFYTIIPKRYYLEYHQSLWYHFIKNKERYYSYIERENYINLCSEIDIIGKVSKLSAIRYYQENYNGKIELEEAKIFIDDFLDNENSDIRKLCNEIKKLKEKFGQISPINNYYTLQLDAKEISQENLDISLTKLAGKVAENKSVGIGKGLRIPIGKSSGKTFHFTFGHESNCFNAIIGGQSGKGKTVLLNNIIAKGLEKYNSDELRFAIIDCSGVGFYEFEEATNIHLLCRSSNVETCMKAVKILEDELDRRENLFREVGVSDIEKYIDKTQQPLPRIICLLDEFHVLYTGGHRSDTYFDKVLVDRIIRVGRKFGMHLIGSTQSLGGGVRRSILDNIPLRIALGMTTSQSNGFLDSKNDAATNLEVGKAVYNDKNGDNEANKFVNVNYITEEDIERIIAISNNDKNTILNFETIKLV